MIHLKNFSKRTIMQATETSGLHNTIEDIYRKISNKYELIQAEPVEHSNRHTVLFKLPYNSPPAPFESRRKDGEHYIPLPNLSIRTQKPANGGGNSNESMWPLIVKSLSRSFNSISDLENAISNYNKIGKLKSLHEFHEQVDESNSEYFFKELLPGIINLALRLPKLIKAGIPYLRQGQNHSISMSQEQASCLLANAFLCTFPRRKSESSYANINFDRLFEYEGHHVVEKIKCILNYFQRVINKTPTGILTFTRRSINYSALPKWSQIDAPISDTPLHITSEGTIEDQGIGLLQVDFANKYIGGGVIGGGCVQEEIRFIICPELIISRLFTEFLNDNEALIMIGAEQFSKYNGYGFTFEFDKQNYDTIPFDEYNRRQNHIVAIDALHFPDRSFQYTKNCINRELNKAYVGFYNSLQNNIPCGVASGNWGCGAFRGDPKLKSLIQLMACTVTGRSLLYFTFGEKELKDEINQMQIFFKENNINIKQLWQYLIEYKDGQRQNENLFEFIQRKHKQKSFSITNEAAPDTKQYINSNETKYKKPTSSLQSESVTSFKAKKQTSQYFKNDDKKTLFTQSIETTVKENTDDLLHRKNKDDGPSLLSDLYKINLRKQNTTVELKSKETLLNDKTFNDIENNFNKDEHIFINLECEESLPLESPNNFQYSNTEKQSSSSLRPSLIKKSLIDFKEQKEILELYSNDNKKKSYNHNPFLKTGTSNVVNDKQYKKSNELMLNSKKQNSSSNECSDVEMVTGTLGSEMTASNKESEKLNSETTKENDEDSLKFQSTYQSISNNFLLDNKKIRDISSSSLSAASSLSSSHKGNINKNLPSSSNSIVNHHEQCETSKRKTNVQIQEPNANVKISYTSEKSPQTTKKKYRQKSLFEMNISKTGSSSFK